MNSFDETVARLEAGWPAYQGWYVPRAVGGGPPGTPGGGTPRPGT